jgi:hypothetical protein
LPIGYHQLHCTFVVIGMKDNVLWLVIGIPLAAIIMSAIAVWIAVADPDPGVMIDHPPLQKSAPHRPS